MMGIAEVNKEPHKQRQQLKERKLNKEKNNFSCMFKLISFI